MSVKFQEETVRAVTGRKPEDLAHRVGERLTGGKTQTGYLQVCSQLVEERMPYPRVNRDRKQRDMAPS